MKQSVDFKEFRKHAINWFPEIWKQKTELPFRYFLGLDYKDSDWFLLVQVKFIHNWGIVFNNREAGFWLKEAWTLKNEKPDAKDKDFFRK